jgi:hypothetical protein
MDEEQRAWRPLRFLVNQFLFLIAGSFPVNYMKTLCMHENANIAFQLQETSAIYDIVLSLQPRVGGGKVEGEKRVVW